MPIHDSVTLNTGAVMPTVGLGTWKSAPGEVEKAVEYALKEAGYRHIDTALVYAHRNKGKTYSNHNWYKPTVSDHRLRFFPVYFPT